jgi:hypothetical protein
VDVARVVLGTKRYPELFKNSRKRLKLCKFITISFLVKKMQIIYKNYHKNKTYLLVLKYYILVWNNFECNLKTYLSTIFEHEFKSNLGIKSFL